MNNQNTPPKFTLSISLAVVNHLATNLYTDISSVLTEIVANAWDANATEVHIKYAKDQYLEVLDNGLGMNLSDLNDRYLMIAYEKRKEVTETPAPYFRKPMGRKGIGKLAPINIAYTVLCESVKDGDSNGLKIDYKELLDSINKQNNVYHPPEIACSITEGTRITLKDFRKSVSLPKEDTIRRQLARKFSVIGSKDFKVYLNDQEITVHDRDDLGKVEYIWVFGDASKELVKSINVTYYKDVDKAVEDIKKKNVQGIIGFVLDNKTVNGNTVLGWIGTANKPGNLVTNYGSLNNLIVLSRGRNIQNNILDDISETRVFKSYITGNIEADVLDEDKSVDMASSAREALLKSDPRYKDLKQFLKSHLNEIGNAWDDLRRAYKTEEQFQLFPILKNWVESLDQHFQADAEKTLSAVVNLHSKDEDKDKQREILKGTIYGFERLKTKQLQVKFHESLNSDVSVLLSYLEDRNKLESSLLYDVTSSRLEAVNELIRLKNSDAIESAFQKHIAKHLWLLDSGWDLADNVPPHVENTINTIFDEIIKSLSPQEKRGRLDIKYMTHAGEHVIVELKRESRKDFDIFELARQGKKYYDGLHKGLEQCHEQSTFNIETIFIIGDDAYERISNSVGHKSELESTLKTCKGRIVTYSQLITNAQKQYQAYLENQEKAANLAKIVEQL